MATSENLKQKKVKVKKLLAEAINLLCRNSLTFSEELTVEGLIGITIDKNDVLLIRMDETLHGNEAAPWSPEAFGKFCCHHEDSSAITGGVKTTHSLENGSKEVVVKSDHQNLMHEENYGHSNPQSDGNKSSKSSQPTRRKQRKPVQIKDEVNNLDDAEDVWSPSDQKAVSTPLIPSESPGLANASYITAQEAFNSEARETINLGSCHSSAFTSCVDDCVKVPDLYCDPSPSGSTISSRSLSSLESVPSVSLRGDGPILSVPSPHAYYASLKMPGAIPLSVGQENVKMYATEISNAGKSCAGLSDEEQESPGLYGDNQAYPTDAQASEISDLPIDLSMDAANSSLSHQQHHTSQVLKSCRKRARVSSNSHHEIVSAHGAVRCPVCRKWFDSRIKYNRHKRSHRGIFTCKVCGRAYNRKDNMQRHYKLYHAEFLAAQGMQLDDGFTVSQQQSPTALGEDSEELLARDASSSGGT